MLSCLNVSRANKMEGARGIPERKFCQLCSLEVASPVDYHHPISILQYRPVCFRAYPFGTKIFIVSYVAYHHVYKCVFIGKLKTCAEAASTTSYSECNLITKL